MSSHFSAPSSDLLDRIKAVVGDAGWKSPKDAPRYFEDPRNSFTGQACLIVMPGTVEQVAQIVKLCNAHKAGIIPYGGGTGVVAGQLAPDSQNAIILSLEKMNRIREISPLEGVMVAEAGCILENLHEAAATHSLQFPLSMASKGSCSIGGNLATNAGGIQVLRYGNARDLCLGIEAVLPNGALLNELSPLRKNNTGFDLRHLLIGSEGTLGIITAATLVLMPIDPETVTVFCAIRSPADALSIYRHLRADLGECVAGLELMSDFGLELVTSHFKDLRNPLSQNHPWYLLVEITGHIGIRDRVEKTLSSCIDDSILSDAVIAESEAQRTALWDLREKTPEANSVNGAFCNSDTAVPIGKVDVFIAETTKAIKAIGSDLRINSYGHIGDGNIHHNVFPAAGVSKKEFVAAFPKRVEAVRMAINDVTHRFNGTISAEHGIGRLKSKDFEIYVSESKREAIKKIKTALDPNNVLNPGALISGDIAEQ